MSDVLLPVLMAVTTLGAILLGVRVAIALAGSAAVFILVSDLPTAFFNLIVSRIYANALSNWLLVAVPMFIFMGLVLEKSGVAERALKGAQAALGGTPAGLGVSVLVIGVLLAASSGIVGASVVLLALLGLPRLREAGYPNSLSAGLLASSGTLAILIPPSVMLIVLSDQLKVPVQAMFAGALVPGLILVVFYGVYTVFRTWRLPRLAQSADEQRGVMGLLVDVGPLVLLVCCVLGSIVTGLATPTEASGVGAFGAILITALYGRFRLAVVMDAARDAVLATAMVMFVIIGATCFSAVFKGVGGDSLIRDNLLAVGEGPWAVLFVIMALIFVLGFVLDWLEISLILMPILGPVVAGLDFGNGLSGDALLIWFGVLVAVNLQTSFITPPFGFSLFYLRGAVKDQLDTSAVYRGVVPFIALQLLAVGLLMAFPMLIL